MPGWFLTKVFVNSLLARINISHLRKRLALLQEGMYKYVNCNHIALPVQVVLFLLLFLFFLLYFPIENSLPR